MKKIYMILMLIFVLALSACGGDDDMDSSKQDGSLSDENMSEDNGLEENGDSTVSYGDQIEGFKELEVPNADFTVFVPNEIYDKVEEGLIYAYSFEPNSVLFEFLTEEGTRFMDEVAMMDEMPELSDEELQQYFIQLMVIIRGETDSDFEVYDGMVKYFADNKDLVTKGGYSYKLYFNETFENAILTEDEAANLNLIISELTAMTGDVVAQIELPEGEGDIVFHSVSLDGDEVTSDVFRDYELTMINIWASWCGPCVSELPDLGELYHELPDGVNLIGFATDGDSAPEEAKAMLKEYDCDYVNVISDNSILNYLNRNVRSIPTTIFVDSNGNLVGDPMIGVPLNPKEDYLAKINELLDELRQ